MKAIASIPAMSQGRRLCLRAVFSWTDFVADGAVFMFTGSCSVDSISVGDSVMRGAGLATVGRGSSGAVRKAPSARQKFMDSSVYVLLHVGQRFIIRGVVSQRQPSVPLILSRPMRYVFRLRSVAGVANCQGFLPDERIEVCMWVRTTSLCCTRARNLSSYILRAGCRACRAAASTSERVRLRGCTGSALLRGSAIRKACRLQCCPETSLDARGRGYLVS